jgi:hypothetical protein
MEWLKQNRLLTPETGALSCCLWRMSLSGCCGSKKHFYSTPADTTGFRQLWWIQGVTSATLTAVVVDKRTV